MFTPHRPAAARMAGQGGGVIPTSAGTPRSISRGQLAFALIAGPTPVDVRFALAKVERGLALTAAEVEAVRSYLVRIADALP